MSFVSVGSLHGWTAFSDIRVHYFLPLSLCFEDEFHRIAESTFTSGVWGRVMGFFLDLSSGILHGDCKAAGSHGGEVDYIVSDKGGFFQLESSLFDDFLKGSLLVLNSLTDEFKFQVAGPKGDRL